MWVSEEARASQAETGLLPASSRLFEAWNGLRAGRTAPRRTDLDLAQFARLAPNLFILEPAAGGGFVFRLAGTGVGALMGGEVTGSDLLAPWGTFERGVIGLHLRGVAMAHKQAQIRLCCKTGRGEELDLEMLALPLTARDGASTHVLGGLFPIIDKRHLGTPVPAEVRAARFIDAGAAFQDDAPAQARRKFRVISGGLNHG